MTCQHKKAKCINSRKKSDFRYRRYKCECGERFSTVEVRTEMSTGGSKSGLDFLKDAISGITTEQERAIKNLIESFTSK